MQSKKEILTAKLSTPEGSTDLQIQKSEKCPKAGLLGTATEHVREPMGKDSYLGFLDLLYSRKSLECLLSNSKHKPQARKLKGATAWTKSPQ